jgi:hypothetical protein
MDFFLPLSMILPKDRSSLRSYMHRYAQVLIRLLQVSLIHNQGRVLYDVFIYTQPSGGYFIEYDSRQSEAALPLLLTLKRYVLRSKVKLRDVSDEYNVWAAWGSEEAEPGRRWNWVRSGSIEPAWDGAEWPWGVEDCVIRDRRAVGMGKRRLVRKGDKRELCLNYFGIFTSSLHSTRIFIPRYTPIFGLHTSPYPSRSARRNYRHTTYASIPHGFEFRRHGRMFVPFLLSRIHSLILIY